MSIADRLYENSDVINYINDAFRMVYHNEQNEEKVFCWWLNKFEYLANVTYVPNEKMAELFLEMVHEDIHKRVKEKYPYIDFTELSYEEIINRYISYFNDSPEILWHRNSFKHRNDYEQKVVINYACELRTIYNKSLYSHLLEEKISNQYVTRLDHIKFLKYRKRVFPVSSESAGRYIFSNGIEVARYINQALWMINIYNSENADNFHEWLHKIEYVANIIKVPDDTMIEFFINLVDNDVHSTVKDIYPFITSSKLSYEEIINSYLQYFSPVVDSDLNKTRLLCRKKYKDESIENYVNCLRKLSDKCSKTNRQNEILFEQFINGINDIEIKTILKKFRCFSFDEMVKFATELIQFKKIITRMQLPHLRLKTYHPVYGEDFCEWLNKFEYIADSLKLSDDENFEFLCNMLHYEVLVDWIQVPVQNLEIKFHGIISIPIRRIRISALVYLHRRLFVVRKQYEKETIEHYALILRKLYDKCNYIDLSGKILRDQFCNGIHDNKIKTYIGKYPNLSFKLTVGLAIAYSIELSLMENE